MRLGKSDAINEFSRNNFFGGGFFMFFKLSELFQGTRSSLPQRLDFQGFES